MGTDQLPGPDPLSTRQWVAFVGATVLALLLAGLAGNAHPEIFTPYFGATPPMVAVALAALAGGAALWLLDRIQATPTPVFAASARSLCIAALLTLPFAAIAISIDLGIGFPRDINVPLPWALAFYPVMAVFVEFALHVVPFTLILLTGQRMFGPSRAVVTFAIVLPALIEPLLQVGYAGGANLLATLVGAHVFAISVTQLALFWRYGFWAMLAFRLVYYALWHIAWGAARLDLLF